VNINYQNHFILNLKRIIMKKYLLMTLFYLPATLFSQSPQWKNYTPGHDIKDMSWGDHALYIATEGGIVRYDTLTGNSTFINRATDFIPSNSIQALSYHNGKLYAAFGIPYQDKFGFGIFDGISWTFYTTQNSPLPNDDVRDILAESDTVIWLAISGGLVKIQGNSWTLWNMANSSLPSDDVKHICKDSNDNIWVATFSGIARFDDPDFTVVSTSGSNDMVADNSGGVWIAGDGLLYIKNSIVTQYNHLNIPVLPDDPATAIGFDNTTNKVWAGFSGYELAVYDYSTWNVAIAPVSWFKALTADGEGNIYVGFYDDGGYKFDGVDWNPITTSNSGISGEGFFQTGYKDMNGVLWLGYVFAGVDRVEEGVSWTNYGPDNSAIPSEDVIDIVGDTLGDVWMATLEDGLLFFDGISWTQYLKTNSGLPSNRLTAIDLTDDNKLWIATEKNGLALFDGTTWSIYDTSNSDLPDNNIHDIKLDHAGNLWAGTNKGGLVKFNGSFEVFNTTNSSIPSNGIQKLALDNNDAVWMTTKESDGGIIKFNGTTWEHYDYTNSPLLTEPIDDMIIDHNNNAWMTQSGSGVLRVTNDFTAWDVFSYENYPITYQYINALTEDAAGQIWMMSAWNGLAVYQPDSGIFLAVNPEVNDNPVQIYPTIFSDEIQIQTCAKYSGPLMISMFNQFGQQEKMQQYTVKEGAFYHFHFSTSALAAGTYILSVKYGDQKHSQVLIKQ